MYVFKRFEGHQNTDVSVENTPAQDWALEWNTQKI